MSTWNFVVCVLLNFWICNGIIYDFQLGIYVDRRIRVVSLEFSHQVIWFISKFQVLNFVASHQSFPFAFNAVQTLVLSWLAQERNVKFFLSDMLSSFKIPLLQVASMEQLNLVPSLNPRYERSSKNSNTSSVTVGSIHVESATWNFSFQICFYHSKFHSFKLWVWSD